MGTLSGDNGLIKSVKNSKTSSIVGKEIEQVEYSYKAVAISSPNHVVTSSELQAELNQLVGSGKTTVSGTGTLTVKFLDTNNRYSISSSGTAQKL